MALGYSAALRNAQLDAITTAVGNAGKLAIYTGTRPVTGGTITSQTKLAEFTMGSPFAGAASAGALSVTVPSATTGLAAGTAAWARLTTSGGTFVMDLSVTATGGGGDMTLNTDAVSIGVNVSLTSVSIAAGNA